MSSRTRLDRHHLGCYTPDVIKLANRVVDKTGSPTELAKVVVYCKPHVETDEQLRHLHGRALKKLAMVGGNVGWPERHLPKRWLDK